MDERVCPKCQESKPLARFRLKASGRREVYCEPCKRVYDVDYYERTKARRQSQRRTNVAAIRDRNRRFVWEYLLGRRCQTCGEADPIVLEFDHRDSSEKVQSIANLISWGASLTALAAEIRKCDVLCANCHRRRTAKQLGWAKVAG